VHSLLAEIPAEINVLKPRVLKGHAFSRAENAIETTWASQPAKKLNRAVGRGFIPGKNQIQSARASAPEACSSKITPKMPQKNSKIYRTLKNERKRQEVSGHAFSRAESAIKTTWASQPAKKLNRAVGRGFIPGKK